MDDALELKTIRQYQLALALGDGEAAAAAFTAVYNHCNAGLVSYLQSKGLVQGEIEEIERRVWEKALGVLPEYEDRGVPFSHWLKRAAWNRVREAYRGRKQDRARLEEMDENVEHVLDSRSDDPLDLLVQAERQAAIREALDSALAGLSERDRRVVLERIGDDWRSSDEVAAKLGLSRTNVDTIFSRATHRLREILVSSYGLEQLCIWAGTRLSETGRRTVRRASGFANPSSSERRTGSGRARTGEGA